jgi:hypothetical protein
MIIDTKFEIGDRVWFIDKELEMEIDCVSCEGSGNLYTISNKSTECNRCWGTGIIEVDRPIVKNGVISFIEIRLFDTKKHLKEFFGHKIQPKNERYGIDGNSTLLKKYYSSREEAEKIVEEIMKKEVDKNGHWIDERGSR